MDVIIVEDEKYQAEMLAELLKKYDANIIIKNILTNVDDTVDYFKRHKHPDLVFLDIELKNESCFSIFNQVELTSPVIFTTAHSAYSLDAFYYNGIHYLIKPITMARLHEGMQKYYLLKGTSNTSSGEDFTSNKKLIIKTGNKNVPFNINDIMYFIIDNGFVYLHAIKGGKYLVDYKLEELSDKLDARHFFRLNRQTLVNRDAIKEYRIHTRGRLKVSLANHNDPVVISFKKRHEFISWLKNDDL